MVGADERRAFFHLSNDQATVLASPLGDASRWGIPPHNQDPHDIEYDLTAVYDYSEFSGCPFGRKARYEAWASGKRVAKTFRQSFSWGRDGWLPRAPRKNSLPPFRAPVIPAIDRDRRIIFSEGEKGVFAAIRAGWENDGAFFSCCLSEGRTDLEPLEWRRDVWLLPDADLRRLLSRSIACREITESHNHRS